MIGCDHRCRLIVDRAKRFGQCKRPAGCRCLKIKNSDIGVANGGIHPAGYLSAEWQDVGRYRRICNQTIQQQIIGCHIKVEGTTQRITEGCHLQPPGRAFINNPFSRRHPVHKRAAVKAANGIYIDEADRCHCVINMAKVQRGAVDAQPLVHRASMITRGIIRCTASHQTGQ